MMDNDDWEDLGFRPCLECDNGSMSLEYTGEELTTAPPRKCRQWLCSKCKHTLPASAERNKIGLLDYIERNK